MTRIAHLSDLHFGSTDPRQLDALARVLVDDGITQVILTGDITQEGRKREFEEAHEWFRALPIPIIAIPGNHDTPVRNLVRRFVDPWSRYEEITGFVEEPILEGDEFIFAGLNSAHRMRPSLDWSTGKLGKRQLERIGDAFGHAEERLRICGFHHPIRGIEDAGSAGKAVMPKADRVVSTLTGAKVDVVMTGHVHRARISTVQADSWTFVMSQAGTAVSTRLRGEPASYNVLTTEDDDRIRLSVHRWSETAFEKESAHHFERNADGWRELP